jgi:hypothetical protein
MYTGMPATRVVANLTEALTAAGAELADVLKTTVYIASADRADLVAVWDIVRTAFAGHDPPSTHPDLRESRRRGVARGCAALAGGDVVTATFTELSGPGLFGTGPGPEATAAGV